MQELWVDIPGFSRYQVSNLGHLWNVVFKRPMLSSRTKQGHMKISLIDDGEVRRSCSVAQLVAQGFCERPNNYCTEVILLDGDLMNVAAYNLAWRPPRHAYLYARQLRTDQPLHFCNLPILNVETGYIYDNVLQAGISEGLLFQDVWESTYTGKRVFPHGHTYEIYKRV